MANLAFFGTPEFSLPALEAVASYIQNYGHKLSFVVTQPDARAGRGKILSPPAVKKRALEHNFLVLQPQSLRKNTQDGDNFYQDFVNAKIDLAIVVAYGNIIPQRFLSAARLGFVNIHGSLLPRFRGAAPVQRAIEAGDKESGVCLMDMVLKLDEGDILAQKTTPILSYDNSASLFHRLSYLGAYLLAENLENLMQKRLKKVPQSLEGILYAPMLSKSEGAWDFQSSGRTLALKARAFDPWPSLYGFINGRRVMFFKSFFIQTKVHEQKPPGMVVVLTNFLGIRTHDGIVYFQGIQFEGRQKLLIKDARASHVIRIGDQIELFSSQ
jgi:methionyl-tRNA formyltransferase